MRDIHQKCVDHGTNGDGKNAWVNYVDGANIAGFKKVADAMLAYSVVLSPCYTSAPNTLFSRKIIIASRGAFCIFKDAKTLFTS